jgi:hypothetical protein
MPISDVTVATTIAVLVWTIGLAAFIYALRTRLFARFEHGFFLSLMIAIAGVAILSMTVIGVWGYFASRRSIEQEIVVSMSDIGGIVESQVAGELKDISAALGRFAASVQPRIGKATPEELRERLQGVQYFDSSCSSGSWTATAS